MANIDSKSILAFRRGEVYRYDKDKTTGEKTIRTHICYFIQALKFNNKSIFIYESVADKDLINSKMGFKAKLKGSDLLPHVSSSGYGDSILYDDLNKIEKKLNSCTLKFKSVSLCLNHKKIHETETKWDYLSGKIDSSSTELADIRIIEDKIARLRTMNNKPALELYIREYNRIHDAYVLDVRDGVIELFEKEMEKRKKEKAHSGEEEVDYQLKWLGEEYISIERKCLKYDKECIVLKNINFISEEQEYDHIIVSDQAVYLIETKNYYGTVEINDNGNWTLKSKNNNGVVENKNVESPDSQVFRHRQLIESILKGIVDSTDIVDIICIANKNAIIEGENNCKIPIVKYDTLARYIMEINNTKEKKYNKTEIVNEIEKYYDKQHLKK